MLFDAKDRPSRILALRQAQRSSRALSLHIRFQIGFAFERARDQPMTGCILIAHPSPEDDARHIVRIHALSPPHAAICRRVHVEAPPQSAAQTARRYWRPAASDDALATKRYMGSAAVFSVTAASDSGSTAISAAEP